MQLLKFYFGSQFQGITDTLQGRNSMIEGHGGGNQETEKEERSQEQEYTHPNHAPSHPLCWSILIYHIQLHSLPPHPVMSIMPP